eukprot:350815-Chlamydomonas_euryale.AAC.6
MAAVLRAASRPQPSSCSAADATARTVPLDVQTRSKTSGCVARPKNACDAGQRGGGVRHACRHKKKGTLSVRAEPRRGACHGKRRMAKEPPAPEQSVGRR